MPKTTKAYIAEIKQILIKAKTKAYKAVNYAMVEAYWLIGKRIVEEIQQGKNRANYGEQVINNVSKALTDEFGRGFSKRTIWQCRQFYQMFPKFSIKRSLIAVSTNTAKSAIADRTIKTTKSKANLAIADRQIQALKYNIY